MKHIFSLTAGALLALASPASAGSNFDWKQLQSFQKTGFFGAVGAGGVASDVTCAQVWNPASSGKVLVVWQITSAETVAGQVSVGYSTTELSIAASAPALNKYAGAAAPVALLRVQNSASFTFAGGGVFWAEPLAANTAFAIPLQGPMIVPTGQGLTVCTVTLNDQLNISVEWDEVNG